jgi:hypothetical protein
VVSISTASSSGVVSLCLLISSISVAVMFGEVSFCL